MFDQRRAHGLLSAELEAQLLRQIMIAWRDLNYTCFRDRMRPPVILLGDSETRLGRFIPETRCIEISRTLVCQRPWGVVLEVLKHEMAHQFVHEVLGAGHETAHGPTFQRVCEHLGIDAAASGTPSAAEEESEEDVRVLRRISRLLALAESPNLHEAEAAMKEAQRLMLKHNLETVPRGRSGGYGFRHLGRPSGRISESERLLAMILGEHFFVEAIWVPSYLPEEGRAGRVLEICGTRANMDMAEYVYAFLRETAERLWRDHKHGRGIRGNRDRRTFLAGVMRGFHERLCAQKVAYRQEGLVYLGDAGLRSYFRRRYPRIQHTRYAGSGLSEAHETGRAAGRGIILNRPVTSGGTPRGALMLLPGK